MPRGYSKETGKPIQLGNRFTVEQRRALRDRNNILRGKQPGWAEEALDYYLNGFEVDEILRTFNVKAGVFYNSIAKAALYRLMMQHQAERLAEIPELSEDKNK